MIRTNDDESDMSSDEVDNASVPVHAIPVQHVASTHPTDNTQPMVVTTNDDMYQGFVEVLFILSDDTGSLDKDDMRPQAQTITVNAPSCSITQMSRRSRSMYHIYQFRLVYRELSQSLTLTHHINTLVRG